MDWKPLPRPSVSLLLNTSCTCANLPFGHVWSTVPMSGWCSEVVWAWSARSSAEKRVVSLAGYALSAGLQTLSYRMNVACLSLFYKYYYGKCSSELAYLVPPKRVTVRKFLRRCIVLCAGLSSINQAFFLAWQPILIPSLMNAFHQIRKGIRW